MSHGLRPFNWFCVSDPNKDDLWVVAPPGDIFHCWFLVLNNDIVTSPDLESSCVLLTDPANTVNHTIILELIWSK
jgi:hypothetical protein